jgi:hypothetical protein
VFAGLPRWRLQSIEVPVRAQNFVLMKGISSVTLIARALVMVLFRPVVTVGFEAAFCLSV